MLIALLALPGCYGSTSAYVEAEAPVGVVAYPHTEYDGRVVYWVGDRWYLRDRGAWFYYRVEPAPLGDYRARWYGYHSPPPRYRPYYDRPHYRRPAPPARRVAPPTRRSAPPARHRR